MVTELSLDEMARRLDLPRDTVDRWIRQGRMPARRQGEQVLFDRRELEAWAASRRINFAGQHAPAAPSLPILLEDLATCMARGGVHHGLEGGDARAVLAAAVQRLPVDSAHRDQLLTRLVEREALSSTGIGNGVAIPHPRSPQSEAAGEAIISTCFLAEPVDFDAIDGKPVFVLFVLVTPAVKVHLHILARLAFCLRDDSFVAFLAQRPDAGRLLAEVARRDVPQDREPGA